MAKKEKEVGELHHHGANVANVLICIMAICD
jgi:hypothetical protein